MGLHCLTEVTAVKVTKELHSMLHNLMHWHEHGLLGKAKPINQLVANIQESRNSLKVVLNALIEVVLCEVRIAKALLTHNIGTLHETDVLETLAHQAEQCWTVFLLSFRKL